MSMHDDADATMAAGCRRATLRRQPPMNITRRRYTYYFDAAPNAPLDAADAIILCQRRELALLITLMPLIARTAELSS